MRTSIVVVVEVVVEEGGGGIRKNEADAGNLAGSRLLTAWANGSCGQGCGIDGSRRWVWFRGGDNCT